MTTTRAFRGFYESVPARVSGSDGMSNVIAFATSSTAVPIDLSKVPGLTDDASAMQLRENPSVLGHYVEIQPEGTDLYILFGPTLASVSGANAPSQATLTTITNGIPTPAAGVPIWLPSALGPRKWPIPLGALTPSAIGEPGMAGPNSPWRWLSVVTKGAGTGICRIYQADFAWM